MTKKEICSSIVAKTLMISITGEKDFRDHDLLDQKLIQFMKKDTFFIYVVDLVTENIVKLLNQPETGSNKQLSIATVMLLAYALYQNQEALSQWPKNQEEAIAFINKHIHSMEQQAMDFLVAAEVIINKTKDMQCVFPEYQMNW